MVRGLKGSRLKFTRQGEKTWKYRNPPGIPSYENIPDIELFNVTLMKPTDQSSTAFGAVSSRAVDGNPSGIWNDNSVTHTYSDQGAWWKVDLEQSYDIFEIIIYNRADCCGDRLDGFSVEIYEDDVMVWSYQNPPRTPPYENTIDIPDGVRGDELMVKLLDTVNEVLSLAEVVFMGSE